MILSKDDYKYYKKKDKEALAINRKIPKIIGDDIWKFEIILRKLEFNINTRGNKFIYKPYSHYLRYVFRRKSIKLGYSIGTNVFGPGLSIAHRGTIVINGNCKIGKNCRIHVCTNLGTKAGFNDLAPKLGDNVYIGPGAKIFGDIEIADDIAIGANSVVNKSFLEKGVTIAGVPATVISRKGTKNII